MQHRLFLIIALIFIVYSKLFSQKNELPIDTSRFFLIDYEGANSYYMYRDSVYSTSENYNWPFLELNVFSGLNFNTWTFVNPSYIGSLDDLTFTEKADGIKRISKLGSY